jgi:hypothetical protein
VGLGLLHGLVTVIFSGAGSLAPHPIPNLDGHGLHFDLSGMGGPTRSIGSHQHSSPGHWGAQTFSPLHGGSPRRGHVVTIIVSNIMSLLYCRSSPIVFIFLVINAFSSLGNNDGISAIKLSKFEV